MRTSSSTSSAFAWAWQFDLGPVNFDFNYTLGLNSFTKTDYRTSSHVAQFNLGWLF